MEFEGLASIMHGQTRIEALASNMHGPMEIEGRASIMYVQIDNEQLCKKILLEPDTVCTCPFDTNGIRIRNK